MTQVQQRPKLPTIPLTWHACNHTRYINSATTVIMNRESIVVSSIATVIMHHGKQCVCVSVCVCVQMRAHVFAYVYVCVCVCMFSKCMLVYASVGSHMSDNICAYACPYECVHMAHAVRKLFRITFNTSVEEKSLTWAEKSSTWVLFCVHCSDRPLLTVLTWVLL